MALEILCHLKSEKNMLGFVKMKVENNNKIDTVVLLMFPPPGADII